MSYCIAVIECATEMNKTYHNSTRFNQIITVAIIIYFTNTVS